MLCAISGEAPQQPVASRKSGTVYEKSLIESYIATHGTDPVDGSDLTVDDLVELKTARTVRPRPPALTSIPALLSTFQNEWDALALETYELRQHLSQLRQELSTALYNNDAAVRVIARLTRERDEARDALGKVSLGGRAAVNGHRAVEAEEGDAMVVDGGAVPSEVVEKVVQTQDRLSKTRRKRPVPEGWATPDMLQAFEPAAPAKVLSSHGRSLALDSNGSVAVVGGADGSSAIFSLDDEKVLQHTKETGEAVTDILLWTQGSKVLSILSTASGEIAILDGSKKQSSFTSHVGPAFIALHPSQELLASVGTDKSVVLYDLLQQKEVSKIISDSVFTACAFHPDGHLLAAGTVTGVIKIFDAKTLSVAAIFEASGPIASLSFSENGFWLAVAVADSTAVSIWDLRKAAEVKSLEFGGKVSSVRFDYSGQYLAGAGPAGLTVQAYDKGSKAWSDVLRKALAAKAVGWGPQAKSLVVLMADGSLTVLQ